MKIDYDATGSIIVQQTSSTVFDGTDVGRASVSLGAVDFRARHPGTDANDFSIRLSTAGIEVLDSSNDVLGRASLSDFLAGTIVTAVNNVLSRFIRARTSTPLVPVAPGFVTLAGGLDPIILGNQYKYDAGAAHGGLFYFDQRENYIVTQIEGRVPAGAVGDDVFVDLINLDEGLVPIAAEYATVYAAKLSAPDLSFTITDVKCQLGLFRALRIRVADAGNVRVQVRREATQPTS